MPRGLGLTLIHMDSNRYFLTWLGGLKQPSCDSWRFFDSSHSQQNNSRWNQRTFWLIFLNGRSEWVQRLWLPLSVLWDSCQVWPWTGGGAESSITIAGSGRPWVCYRSPSCQGCPWTGGGVESSRTIAASGCPWVCSGPPVKVAPEQEEEGGGVKQNILNVLSIFSTWRLTCLKLFAPPPPPAGGPKKFKIFKPPF